MITIQQYRVSVGNFNIKSLTFKIKRPIYRSKLSKSGYKESKMGFSRGLALKIILISLLFGVNINNSYSKVCKANSNKVNHIINGNISKKGFLSLYTWNKGNSSFRNRRDDIEVTLER